MGGPGWCRGRFPVLILRDSMNAPRETLAARLRSGPLSIREATQICRGLLSAIDSAHARGTGHGAITPNTIVLEEGRPVLVSEGAPSETRTGRPSSRTIVF